MASISTDSNGLRMILFAKPNSGGQRGRIRMGRTPMRACETVAGHIAHLVTAKAAGNSPELATATWLGKIDAKLHRKLVANGLAEPRTSDQRSSLGTFLNAYIDVRTDIKAGTRELLGYARDHLVEYFGAGRQLKAITAGDALEFRLHLMTKMGENTARRMCGRAKQFFRHAVKKGLIVASPFADVGSTSVHERRDREHFVTPETIAKVIDACPDAQWRLIVALARWGGLRCPSEPLALRWGDVDWDRARIRVPSPKTAHHEGKAFRWLPLFPELRPYLEAVYDAAPEGTEWVITRYRDPGVNLRTHFERIIRKAGFEPWPKPWQNLRSSRETELAETFPIHVVVSWLGNTEAVARKHYLQVTDEHFEKAAQKAAQHTSEIAGTSGQQKQTTPGISEGCSPLPTCASVQAAQQGFEP